MPNPPARSIFSSLTRALVPTLCLVGIAPHLGADTRARKAPPPEARNSHRTHTQHPRGIG